MPGRTSLATTAGAMLAGGLLAVVFGIVLLGGGGSPSTSAAGSLGQDVKAGVVPAAYVSDVSAAGAVCAAAPPAVIAAQIQQESGWNPQAVSPAGAEGISQFMPGTWPHWSQPDQSPFDPDAAIAAQARYDCALASQMTTAQQAGRLPKSLDVTSLMLAAYNAGPAAVLADGGIPNNGQTPGYVSNILTMATSYAASPSTGGGPGAPAGSFAARLIAAAQAEIGVPYAWAGGSYTGPTRGVCTSGAGANDCHIVGFDCSGLVMYAVYQASGGTIKLPHSADAQTRMGTPVKLTDLEPGDIIGFTDPGATTAHHDGIYLGHNELLAAPQSGEDVRIDDLDTPYWKSQQWRAVRFK